MKKKTISILLAICMLVCMCPLSAFAAEPTVINECRLITAFLSNDEPTLKFSFTPTESGTYIFNSNGDADVMAELTDADGIHLAENDDSVNGGINFSLAYNLTAGSTYIYSVSAAYEDVLESGSVSFMYSLVRAEKDIQSVRANNTIEYTQNSNGWYCADRPAGSNETIHWFFYEVPYDADITVFYQDGTMEDTTITEFSERTGIDIQVTSDQSATNQWQSGMYSFSIDMLGQSFPMPVNITATNVQSIMLMTASINIYKNSCGYTNDYTHYDNTIGELVHTEAYVYEPHSMPGISNLPITITYNDGTPSVTCTIGELYTQTGYAANFITDQDYDNVWDIGMHTVTVMYLGARYEVPITIIECPIQSIIVSPPSRDIVENTNGNYETERYDYGNPIHCDPWFRYNVGLDDSYNVTIIYNDNTMKTFSGYSIADDLYAEFGVRPELSTNQSYTNAWGLGPHTVTFSLCGLTAEFTVNIIESPISSISIMPTFFEYIEGTNGYDSNESIFNDATGQWEEYHYYYYNFPTDAVVSVSYKDGRNITCEVAQLEDITGSSAETYSDQSYNSQWGIGSHTYKLNYLGASVDVQINIVENPIDFIELSTTNPTYIRGTHGNITTANIYNDYTGTTESVTYYEYSLYLNEVTAVLHNKDGSVNTLSGIELADYSHQHNSSVMISSDQTPFNGENMNRIVFTVSCLGLSSSIAIDIIPSPVESITVVSGPSTIYEHTYEQTEYQSYFNSEQGTLYQVPYTVHRVDPYLFTLEIHMTDGRIITTKADYDSIANATGNANDYLQISTGESYGNSWSVGENTLTFTYIGVSAQYTINFESHTSGDLTGDDAVSLEDYAAVKSVLSGTSEIPEGQELIYDLDKDGAVDAFDWFIVEKAINGYAVLNDPRAVGDLDNDGNIDRDDLTLMQPAVNNPALVMDFEFKYYDITGDGIIDIQDYDKLNMITNSYNNTIYQ